MPRPERPLYPERGPLHAFALRLRKLRQDAGNPTYLEMAKETGRSSTALSEAAGGDRVPTWDTVEAYVRCCSGDPAAFLADWERLRDLRAGVATRYTDLLLSNLPRRPSSVFVGRQALLESVADSLDATDAGGMIGLALYGMGGVGKTEIALQYAHANLSTYVPLWWITADTRENVVSGLAALTRVLAEDWPVTASEDEAASWANRWLGSHDGWLLVLDNVTNPAAIADVLAVQTSGRVLLTSRRSLDWATHGLRPLHVDVLPRDASIQLLSSVRRAGDASANEPATVTELAKLANELGDLALAVSHARAYLMERPHVTPTEYLSRLRRLPARLLGAAASSQPSEESVARSLMVSLRELGEVNPLAASLLDKLAYVGSDRLPVSVLAPLADEESLDTAIAAAASYCLISRVGEVVSIHRLVQAVIRANHNDARPCRSAVNLLYAALPSAGPETDVAHWPRWSVLAPHIESLAIRIRTDAHLASDPTLSVEGARLLIACGHYLHSQGRYAAALELFEQASESLSEVLGFDHLHSLAAHAGLAGALWSMGRLTEGAALGEAVAVAYRRILGDRHPMTLWSASRVALALREIGRHDEALALIQETVTTCTDVLGVAHPETLHARNILAGCYRAVGRYEEALRLYESTHSDRVRVLGATHPDTLQSRHNLAGGYAAVGRHSEAVEIYAATLSERQQNLGPMHPDTLHTQQQLGRAYLAANLPEKAVEAFEATLRARLHLLGPDHPDTQAVSDDLTRARGRAAQAPEP